MTSSPGAISGLLNDFAPFDRLPPARRDAIDPLLEPLRFRIGQTVLRPDVLPEGVLLLCSGQLRSLGPSPSGRG
ncbi:hypothetical protein VB737_16730, partial [Synechococcus sp. BA-120 BA3]|nr:hypothetical protein [Synechococcus sp. BA-120 BA3]